MMTVLVILVTNILYLKHKQRHQILNFGPLWETGPDLEIHDSMYYFNVIRVLKFSVRTKISITF